MEKDNETLDQGINYSFLGGKLLANPPPGEDIVISGISGTFPETRDVREFRNNLFNKVNMTTFTSRWDYSHPKLPPATGNVPDIDKFDTGFFGVHERQSHSLDTSSRMFLEKVIEAIFDAGLHPHDFENTKTGVFIGTCFSETETMLLLKQSLPDTYAITGLERSMMAHRISYFLKLKGPSYITDTACSSSSYALEHAYRALRLGEIDNAIIGGTSICVNPFITVQFSSLGVLSPDGVCRPFDAMGNGYVRSETIAALILQKSKCAKRIYAHVVHVKTSCDGYKPQGITYPSGLAQVELLNEFYDECNIDRYSLSFLEAHSTGTRVGDPEEALAIDTTLTKKRKTPLLIGSVKSYIGHTEPASGLCSIIKCIIGMEEGVIPPNINFNTPRSELEGIIEGRMKVVTEPMPFQDNRGLLGVNSFGFGGGNCHTLLRWNDKKQINNGLPKDNLPRLVCVSGRTKEAVASLQDEIGKNILDAEHITLLHNAFRKNVDNHVYRGYVLVSKAGEISRSLKYYYEHGNQRPLCIVFGELNKWYDIGRQLLEFQVFADCIQRIQELISGKGFHIVNAFLHKSVINDEDHLLGSLAVQIGIIEILNQLEINPKCSFGYSFGELLSAYYDEDLNFKEVVTCGLVVSEAAQKIAHLYSNDENYQNELSKLEEISKTQLICAWSNKKGLVRKKYKAVPIKNKPHQDSNGKNMVNSKPQNGHKLEMEDIRSILKTKNSAVKNEIWFHNLKEVIKKVTPWSYKISKNKYTDIFIDALIKSRQDTHEDDENISCRVLQIGSSPIYTKEHTSVLTFPSSECQNYLVDFLETVGRLYKNGCNPQIAKLYPTVDLPVSRGTRMISPCIKWNHNRSLFFPRFTKLANRSNYNYDIIRVDIMDEQWKYIQGHVVNGRNLFPATGYLYLVWSAYSDMEGIEREFMNVLFENCKFIKATMVPKKGALNFLIAIQTGTGNFEITQEGSLVVTGKISMLNEKTSILKVHSHATKFDQEILPMTTKDVYKELLLRGYYYKAGFRGIQNCKIDATEGHIKWDGNWVTFMDNMLQLKILQIDSRLLYVPTSIAKIVITGRRHLQWVDEIRKENAGETLNLPVSNNIRSEVTSCGGIEIRGVIASSINRRKNMAVPVLETYTFISNSANLNIEQSVRVNTQIILENALMYTVNAVELIDEFSGKDLIPLTPIIRSVLEDQPLIQSSLKILSKTPLDVDVTVEDKKLYSETNCLLVIASNLLTRSEVLKSAIASLNKNGCIISREAYDFDTSSNIPSEINILTVHRTESETMLLLQPKRNIKRFTFIKIYSDHFSWVPEVQEAIKQDIDDVVLFADSEPNSGIVGLVNCLRREPNTNNIRCLFVTEPINKINSKGLYDDQLIKNMAINVYKNGKWGTYRHLLLNEITDVESEHCFVNVTVRGDLSSLRWIQGPLRYDMIVPLDKELVHIYYAALNFRDVMTAMGKINADVTSLDRREQECVIGFEFSGRDQRGNRVMGVVASGALSTMLLADPYLSLRIPDSWTMAEGATVMCVYLTVIYAIFVLGLLKKGETILIHSGTGGIGQAAICLALNNGCKVYTTVGTQEKRAFLKENYPQLNAQHIGNSRDESFEQMIYRETNGRGVDMVLNSLAEDKLLASVRCLARGGRFIEIGKFDLANNNYINTLLLRNEASFHGVMLDNVFNESPSNKIKLIRMMRDGIERGVIKPINSNVFKASELEQAFRFMATGKHIGKVLVKVREPEEELVVVPTIQKLPCVARYNCDPVKTYVIVGGLGGFGLELADWLVLRGANKLILTSRKGVSTGYQNLRISIWRSYGITVKISTAVVTTKEGCKELIEEALQLGPVGAIFNLAVVLEDAIFENQTPESFAKSFGPKAFATKYLDELTRTMCPDLSQFVVFSSVSCGRGNAGQTNYGMANSVMERICEKRKDDGYPSLAIEWGAIGEVGLVAEMQNENTELKIGGTLQQKISSCLHVLDRLLMQQDVAVVSSMVVAEKRRIVAGNIVDSVLNILGISDPKSVSLHSTLPELGMDSMTAVEIKQTLEREYEVFLTAKDMRDITLARLKEIIEEKSTTNQTAEDKRKSYVEMKIFLRAIDNASNMNIPYIRLESKIDKTTVAPNVLVFPGIESVSKLYEPLASQLCAHVFYIKLNNGKECTIRDMVDNVMPYVEEHVTKHEPYNIVAYSFGIVVALEVVNVLESRGYAGSIMCIDGSPIFLKEIMLNMRNRESDELFETSLICSVMSLFLAPEVVLKEQENLFKCNSWEERLTLAFNVQKKDKQVNIDENYQQTIANNIYGRFNALKGYIPSYNKLKSNVRLHKASEVIIQGLSEDYNLSEFFEKPVEVTTFEGNHATILDSVPLAEAINAYINLNG